MATQDVERRAPVDAERPFAEELDRLRLLLEASSTILGSLDVEAMLPRVLALAQRTLAADAHALWHYDAAADSWRVAAHSGLSDEYVASAVEAIRGQHATVPLDAPIIAEDIATTDWLTPEHRRAHAAEGTRSMMALPLRYGEHVLGTLAFYYRAPHALTEAEKSSALLLANLAAAAMGTAELYQEQRQLAIDRTFVAEASELLASSLDYETTLSNLASLAVPGFADWCAIDMVARDGSIERLAVAHVDPDKVRWAKELAEKYPPDPNAPYGVANVIRTLQPQLLSEIPEDLLRVAVARGRNCTRSCRSSVSSRLCACRSSRETGPSARSPSSSRSAGAGTARLSLRLHWISRATPRSRSTTHSSSAERTPPACRRASRSPYSTPSSPPLRSGWR